MTLLVLGVWLSALVVTLITRDRVAALVLIAASVVWPLVNSSLEGPVLWTVAPEHGLTLTDLFAPLGVLVAIGALRTRRRRSSVTKG